MEKDRARIIFLWPTVASPASPVPNLPGRRHNIQKTYHVQAGVKHRSTSAKLEAFNATINRIVKRVCGYRDLDYLYLKIRQDAVLSVPQL